ncbi:MAG: PDZ domain-containing protein [Gemmatimonadetes bacterium]|nr:PDZ domain-containing protein [Gemmatimonadota bacterium]
MTRYLTGLLVGLAGTAWAQAGGGVQYDVTFTRALAARRTLHVEARFASNGSTPLVVSLPAWTPGAYELSWFARNATAFAASAGGRALSWDKVDHDTWRVLPAGAREVTVAFDYRADSLDNAMAWSRDDFAFFNGTNLFLYREGASLEGPASVAIHSEPGWKVATGMRGSSVTRRYSAASYHELVDMPFFVGAFDLDSMKIAERWVRLATYPEGKLAGDDRRALWDQVARSIPPMVAVFGDQPYDDYTNLLVFDEGTDGGSALEHANSHLGIYTPFIIGNPALPSITAHEIFHLWNVKRARPAEMWPYRYDVAQPTTLLWVSEGITDYYADIAQLRGGVLDSLDFLDVVLGKMLEVDAAPPVALTDASLSTWIHPVDGTAYLYYPKGSLVGLLLDIHIRDASDNAGSLDQVMRDIYNASWKRGRGFTASEFWAAVARVSGGRDFADFAARYVHGREPLPYSSTFALAGIRLQVDSTREPRLGLYTEQDSSGVRVTAVDSGSSAELAGVRPGDYLLVIGDVPVTEGFGERFRARHARGEGREVTVKVRRDGSELVLPMRIQMAVRTSSRLVYDAAASARARRVRAGLLTGRTGR